MVPVTKGAVTDGSALNVGRLGSKNWETEMGAPHNKSRYGEKWDDLHVAVLQLQLGWILKEAGDNVVVSGGWAWCLMSPDHVEYKHAHDLKDIDLFVKPTFLGEFVTWLELLNYSRERTKYDGLSPFYRYATMLQGGIGCSVSGAVPLDDKKIILDVFVQEVPSVVVPQGYRVVEPSMLASFYGKHNPDSLLHGSGQCWSLNIAKRIMDNGDSPIDNREMAVFDSFLEQKV